MTALWRNARESPSGGRSMRLVDLGRAVLHALGRAPIEVPGAGARAEDRKFEGGARARRATRLGSASVTVPAGTFEVEELRVGSAGRATRVWRASQVPLWGLVRAE